MSPIVQLLLEWEHRPAEATDPPIVQKSVVPYEAEDSDLPEIFFTPMLEQVKQ